MNTTPHVPPPDDPELLFNAPATPKNPYREPHTTTPSTTATSASMRTPSTAASFDSEDARGTKRHMDLDVSSPGKKPLKDLATLKPEDLQLASPKVASSHPAVDDSSDDDDDDDEETYEEDDPPIEKVDWMNGGQVSAIATRILGGDKKDLPDTILKVIEVILDTLAPQDLRIALTVVKPGIKIPSRKKQMREKLYALLQKKWKKKIATDERCGKNGFAISDGDEESNTYFTKDMDFATMYNHSTSGKGSKVLLKRTDRVEPIVFDLHDCNEMTSLRQMIADEGDNLVGWTMDESVIAIHVQSAQSGTVGGDDAIGMAGNGAYAPGFSPPDQIPGIDAMNVDSVELKGKTNEAAVIIKQEGQSEHFGLGGGNDGNDTKGNSDKVGDIIRVWKPDLSGSKLKDNWTAMAVPKGLEYFVSAGFMSKDGAYMYWIVHVGVPYQIWFLKGEQVKLMYSMMCKDLKVEMPYFASTFCEKPIRKIPYGDNEYKRRPAGKGQAVGRTVNRLFFVFRMPLTAAPMFDQSFTAALKKFHMLFHAEASPGEITFKYLKMNHGAILEYLKRSIPNDPTDDKILSYINDMLVQCFKRPRNVTHGCALDRFLMDKDIKDFLEDLGANGWNDVSDMLGNIIHDYPRKNLPSWEGMKMKPFDEI